MDLFVEKSEFYQVLSRKRTLLDTQPSQITEKIQDKQKIMFRISRIFVSKLST